MIWVGPWDNVRVIITVCDKDGHKWQFVSLLTMDKIMAEIILRELSESRIVAGQMAKEV